MNVSSIRCIRWIWFAIILLGILNLYIAVPKLPHYDPAGYYAWGQALLTNGNFDATPFVPPYSADNWFFPRITVDGQTVAANKYPIGWSVGAFPFMALGQGLTWIANNYFHKDWPMDCTSALTIRLSWVGIYLWGMAGILAIFLFLKRLFKPELAGWVTACVWLGTSAFAHTWKMPILSHGISMAYVAITYYLSVTYIQRPRLTIALLWGLAAGMVVITRLPNLILLLPTAYLMLVTLQTDAPLETSFLDRLQLTDPLGSRLAQVIVAGALGAFLPLLLQSVAWHMNYHVWFFNGYEVSHEGFQFSLHNLARTLLISGHGILWRHPVLILSGIGIAIAIRKEQSLATRIFAALVGLMYIEQIVQHGSWPTWNDAYGVRWTSDTLVLWGIGLAFLVKHRPKFQQLPYKLLPWGLAAASAIFILVQIFVLKNLQD